MTDENFDWITPSDCDLREFPYMPLDVLRVRDSTLAGLSDGTIRIALMSWCASWHQIPAGSLPDDDTQLARLLGYGRDVKSWRRDREKFGLHGWCAAKDGRLYHPVVCEKANEVWVSRNKQSKRGKAGAAKRWKNNETGDASANAEAEPQAMQGLVLGNSKERKGEERKGKESKQAGTSIVEASAVASPERDRFAILEDACRAAGMRPGLAANETRAAQDWGKVDLDNAEILAVIREFAGRPGYEPKGTLRYFTPMLIEAAERKASAPKVDQDLLAKQRDKAVEALSRGIPWHRDFGPEPGQPGCKASPEVLIRFGYKTEDAA